MRGSSVHCRWLVATLAALFALAAIAVAFTWPRVFDSVLASQLALKPGSRSYNNWVKADVPLKFDIYFFNWTNSEDFPQNTPNVVELGPYRFTEHRERVNITYHQHNDSYSYQTYRSYRFDEAGSNGTLDDNITTLNAIATAAMYRNRHEGFIMQHTLGMALAAFGQQIAVSKTIGEILFLGYYDLMLDFAKSLPDSATGGAPKIDKFGWFYGRNNSVDSDGFMQVTSGISTGLPGQVLKWNNEDHLPYYQGQCSELSGSAGEFFPRGPRAPATMLAVFLPELCRTLRLPRVAAGRLAKLDYHTYAVSAGSFDDGNTCFCNGECGFPGAMNVSACRFGSPSFISLPHFLHAAPLLRDLVSGLAPDPARHSFYFSIEPELGIPLDVAARFQVNMLIEPHANVALFKDVPKMLFPILWVEQHVVLDEKMLAELRFVRTILDWGAIFCAGVALVFAAIVAIATCTNVCRKKKYVPPSEITFEKPRDEAELKLNPM